MKEDDCIIIDYSYIPTALRYSYVTTFPYWWRVIGWPQPGNYWYYWLFCWHTDGPLYYLGILLTNEMLHVLINPYYNVKIMIIDCVFELTEASEASEWCNCVDDDITDDPCLNIILLIWKCGQWKPMKDIIGN